MSKILRRVEELAVENHLWCQKTKEMFKRHNEEVVALCMAIEAFKTEINAIEAKNSELSEQLIKEREYSKGVGECCDKLQNELRPFKTAEYKGDLVEWIKANHIPGKPIDSIKQIMQLTGWCLKTSKDAFEYVNTFLADKEVPFDVKTIVASINSFDKDWPTRALKEE